MDDLTLAGRLAAGDEDAFRTLVDQETTSVFRTCYRILGRVDEAEDATQETFVLAYRSLASFRGDGRPGAWLTRIATRECWRRAAVRARRAAATTALDEVMMDTLPGSPSPLGEVLAAEERTRVRDAVERLGEPYREVVALRFFGELSLLDIAAATGRPEGTIKAQLHRGMERLRRALGPESRR